MLRKVKQGQTIEHGQAAIDVVEIRTGPGQPYVIVEISESSTVRIVKTPEKAEDIQQQTD